MLGTIIAAEATVELGRNSRFKGAICAATVVVKSGAVFLRHGCSTPLPAAQEIPDLEDIDADEVVTSAVTDYELIGNYPNPFNPSTEIKFAMPEAGRVKLQIYSVTGQLVQTLADGEMPSGRHTLTWSSRDQSDAVVASGAYFYQLVAQKPSGETAFTETRKMTLVK